MNLFKVFASAKKGFQEEYASAIITWLLNPSMEHGLGYSFLSTFLEELSRYRPELKSVSEKLSLKLRAEYEKQIPWSSFLEYGVDNAYIDAVLMIDNWIFSIENKIRSSSASNPNQLNLQYKGLRKKFDKHNIAVIFLVPATEDGTLAPKIETAFDNLETRDNDFKCIVTWKRNEVENAPSISKMIEKMLRDETCGIIEPIPEYTRHTLKAFNSFILNDFAGYEYERSSSPWGDNPLTEARHEVDRLWGMSEGYVGVATGISGLFRMQKETLKTFKFQYTTTDMSTKWQWLDIITFNKITKWILNDEFADIDWEGTYSSDVLYKIAKGFRNRVFIGIQGGKEALMKMENTTIRSKKWGISPESGKSKNWIDGETFFEIIEDKDVFTQDEPKVITT